MCELLLCVKARMQTGNKLFDLKFAQEGDVEVVAPDGHGWGECELGGPTYEHVEADQVPDEPVVLPDGTKVQRTRIVEKFRERRHISRHIHGNHNFWRILKLPNVTQLQASFLISPELADDPFSQGSRVLQYRAFYIDRKKLSLGTHAALIAHYEDDARTEQTLTLSFSLADLRAVTSQRTPVMLA